MLTYKYLGVVLGLLLFLSASGQDFNGGIKGGFTLTQVDGDKMGGYHKAGGIFGAFVNRKLNDKLHWQMEMIYIAKGSKKGINPDKGQFDYRRIAINYIEVPILFQFWSGKLKTYFETGLTAGTLVSSKEEDGNGEVIIIGPFKQFELGFLAGFTYPFNDRLSGTGRFAYSISPIGEGNKVSIIGLASYGGSYNNVLQFGLSYNFKSKD